MKRINILIKTLAILGTIFTWIPILAPVFFSITKIITSHRFLFDYLMPAELFPMALFGGILLIIVAKKIQFSQKLVNLSFALAVGSLILCQVFAILSGLDSGRIGPSGWPWLLVILSITIYFFALIGLGTGGIFLLKKLFSPCKYRT
jgi:hypothetical protein